MYVLLISITRFRDCNNYQEEGGGGGEENEPCKEKYYTILPSQQLCTIKSPISEESDCASSSESSGSSESLDRSSESLVASLSSIRVPVFVEQPERNVEHELLALLSLH